ncbi:MAG: tRNA (guanine(46)-N(7))-methyltransferase TrmB [Rhodomicrobium sp.]
MTSEEKNLPGSDERSDSPLRSFGRRRGRKLSPRQSSLLTNGLERLRLDLSQPLGDRGLSSLFADPIEEIWLEIGFGAGEHLIWQAEHNPRAGIIGAEPYMNGVVAALSGLEARQLQGRVRLHADDVHPLLEWLPPASLSRVFMLFPDPWPKKRHRARRLFSPPLLDKMARLLRPGAEFRFASDIADYAEAAIEHALHHPDFELALTFTSANRDALPDWPITRYETKAGRAGRSSTFIVLKRKPSA